MRYSCSFNRDDRCEHDAARECTACFKLQMKQVFEAIFDADFDAVWANRCVSGPEDGVDGFEIFARYE